jgi:hypothetical protein
MSIRRRNVAIFTSRTLLLAAVGVGVTGLAGCYQSPDATLYKPGVYKGVKDPLLAKQREASQQKALLERFDLVQRDR